MADKYNIVITVRLSDVDEIDQPDPLCLPVDELATWRHFEALLQSMYRDPPTGIRVCYLDDEKDWIEVSSDTELTEAISVAQKTDGILQLQVKRTDMTQHTYFESTLPSTTEPMHDTHPQATSANGSENNTSRNHSEPRLVYPHPPSPTVCYPYGPRLVYPDESRGATGFNEPCDGVNFFSDGSFLSTDGSNLSTDEYDLSEDERVRRLRGQLIRDTEVEEIDLTGRNTFTELFEQASSYSSEDKVKFMKKMLAESTQERLRLRNLRCKPEDVIIPEDLPEPTVNIVDTLLMSNPPSPILPVQDPFEVVCQDKPSRDLEQIQLNMQPGNILKPEKPRDSSLPPKEKVIAVTADQVRLANARPSAASVPPVPLLYTLQMMDGAQSGANAVAIEMPEGDNHGAAQKEEDVTASGGASCTSASAETGEVMANRTCQDGAAVGDKVKVEPASLHNRGVSGAKPAAKKSKKSGDSASSKSSPKGSEKSKGKKEAVSKEAKKPVKESSSRKATKEKAGSKTEADVESGEKIVKRKDIKSPKVLHAKDLVKLIAKMQAELHSGIVKDVGKQTDKLLKKTFSRSLSYESSLSLTHNSDVIISEIVHKGIYCDGCNLTIRGIRFKCGNCPDFDFCEKCEASQNTHDPSHVFLKLLRPVSLAGRVDDENVPLLREVIYKESGKKPKIECLEDVPILSISEVTTPGQKRSPPSTPSESHRKAEVSNWVWDSTFDTDKHLYPVEGATGGSNQPPLGDSEMRRLYTLLSIEAEAAKRADDHIEDLIVELPKLSSVPEMAESVHSLATLTTTNSVVDVDADATALSPPPTTTPVETSSPMEAADETPVDTFRPSERPEAEGSEGILLEAAQDEEDNESQASSADFFYVEGEEEDEEEEESESFEQLEVSVDNDEDEGEEKDDGELSGHEQAGQQTDHHTDSDTSDDFCVLDPPSDIGEFEQDMSTEHRIDESVHCTPDVPSMEIVDHVRAEGEAVSLASNAASAQEVSCQESVTAEEMSPVVEEEIVAVEVLKPEAAVPVTEDSVVESDDGKLAEACGGVDEEVQEETKNVEDVPVQIDFAHEDVLMKMSEEERCRFLEMVRTLKERAEDLEKELKMRKEAEEEEKVREKLQLILEEKQRQAVRENDKLEQLQKKKEQEERLKRQQRLQEKEKERKLRQKKTNKELKLSPGGSMGEGAKKKTRATKPPTLMQLALNKGGRASGNHSPGIAVKQQGVDVTSPSSPTPVGRVAAGHDNIIYVPRKDADCQTSGRVSGTDAAAQASQMFQNVASGVSKAAEAAYHTAKDVFYSLQAKQVEKKMYEGVVYSKATPINSKASSTDAATNSVNAPGPKPDQEQQEDEAAWMPPSSVWTPPADTFVPPKSEWTPQQSDWKPPNVNWVPPKSEWTGPKSDWTPPQGYYQPPALESTPTSRGNDDKRPIADEKRCNSTTTTSSPAETTTVAASSSSPSALSSTALPPLPPIQITDPILRREVQGMQLLIEMGFANREQNRRLLQEYDCDVEKAVQSLLQEEREEHWAWGQRH